jgi:hypothetical protein
MTLIFSYHFITFCITYAILIFQLLSTVYTIIAKNIAYSGLSEGEEVGYFYFIIQYLTALYSNNLKYLTTGWGQIFLRILFEYSYTYNQFLPQIFIFLSQRFIHSNYFKTIIFNIQYHASNPRNRYKIYSPLICIRMLNLILIVQTYLILRILYHCTFLCKG